MERAHCFLFFFALFLAFLMIMGSHEVNASHNHRYANYNGSISKMFAFGDSYADTGNLGKLGRDLTRSWYEPYGMTFPRRPTGRFSDGRILPDYIASFLGIKLPVPFKYRQISSNLQSYGMNFAVGGSGVFDTGNLQHNLSVQIDEFESLIDQGTYSKTDLQSAIALVVVSGNDYVHYIHNAGNHTGIYNFIKDVAAQLKLDLKRIHDVGVGKVVVTNLSPLGCTPYITRGYHQRCEPTTEKWVKSHNQQLLKQVKNLIGKENSSSSSYLVLDLHDPFLSIINQVKGVKKFKYTLEACCEGRGSEDNCGEIDEGGVKQYSLCSNPEEYLYWDSVHPTQAGWAAVFELIKPWLIRHFK